MGQYHRLVVIKSSSGKILASLHPHQLHEGAKLVEFSSGNSKMITAVEYLFMSRYNNNRLVVCGDYSEGNLWKCAEEIGNDTIKELPDLQDAKPIAIYCVNLDKKEYIRLSPLEKGTLYPVFILCSNSNGKGGGDYDGNNMHMVGKWCGDRIKFQIADSSKKYKRYKELKVKFNLYGNV